jgi:hypothetical protein
MSSLSADRCTDARQRGPARDDPIHHFGDPGGHMKVGRSLFLAPLALVGIVVAPAAPAGAVTEFIGAMYDVSCASTTMCVAVGYRTPTDARVPSAFHWNGTSWSQRAVPSPVGAQQVTLTGVACVTASNCEAVGFWQPDFFSSEMFAVHWNGSSWSLQTMPDIAGSSTLSAISCSSASHCTAVGWKAPAGLERALVERWNGTTWSGQSLPQLPDKAHLVGVSCPTDTACTAVGSIEGAPGRIALQWGGRSWSKNSTPIPAGTGVKFAELHNVTCTNATHCTAVGQYSIYSTCCSYTVHNLIEKWNGTAWKVQTSAPGGSDFQLFDIACTTGTACTAVGDFFSQTEPVATPTAYRWDGTHWTSQVTGGWFGVSGFVGVDCPATRKCFAVGHTGNVLVISRWNGTDWNRQR